MSLPLGIANRPRVLETPPQAVGSIVQWALRIFLLLLPLLLQIALLYPGTRARIETVRLQDSITAEQLARRGLLAERARLLSPARLQGEAERLGLGPVLPGDGPWTVATAPLNTIASTAPDPATAFDPKTRLSTNAERALPRPHGVTPAGRRAQ